ncbi:MAG: lamin tail domain-containing protein [Candidatus Electryonea clarkiae]|nr:lamin tail domain-containing protein [Candidatus Electryonea clarkiae]MDP8285296.1 lamin tail domain-containing protein [Candidatus Electryonea clarkiae]
MFKKTNYLKGGLLCIGLFVACPLIAIEFYDGVNSIEDIAINEFMASNESIEDDQDGEFDDWIELYNTGEDTIPMNGLFLTDNELNPLKWAFPDTFIAPEDYLVVWADEDGQQDGLHANFKLSAVSGELIKLISQDSTIIDEVTFDAQTTNLSYGRYPNGTGDFIVMSPTFAAENVDGVGVASERQDVVPDHYSVSQNHPNPFNAFTTIQYTLPSNNKVRLIVYNLLGEQIVTLINGEISAGSHIVLWNGKNNSGHDVSSGIYFYLFESDGNIDSRKMLFLK